MITNAECNTPWSPDRANALPTGESIIQRCYRPIWGRWAMLAARTDNTCVVVTITPDGVELHRQSFPDYKGAELYYLGIIRVTHH